MSTVNKLYDFMDNTIIHMENNFESQAYFEANEPKYSKQCKRLLEALKRGETITQESARTLYQIHALARRVLDLKEAGINIDSRRIEGGFKEYFLAV